MWCGAHVAVIVPAHCEERLVAKAVGGIPEWVDRIVVIDDASPDRTGDAVLALDDPRVELVRHDRNRGVGAAISTGYRVALSEGTDVMVVMAGDAQMDPADLPAVLAPVVEGRADYVKGNRLAHEEAWRMPLLRRLGSAALAALTRVAFGLDVHDSQCGYTALAADAARRLPLDDLWPRYGYPNDLLGLVAAHGLRVTEVPVRPVYADETSGLRPWHVLSIAGVIARRTLENRQLTRRASGSPGLAATARAETPRTTSTRGARARSATP